MLLVHATKGPSQIHGFGLIAREFIPKGTIMWEFMPNFDVAISPDEVYRLSNPARDQLLFYCYFDFDRGLYVLSGDDDRFTNHSDTPNCEDEPTRDATRALIDIHPGDEITWNYWLTAPWHLDSSHKHLLPHEYPESHVSHIKYRSTTSRFVQPATSRCVSEVFP
jgi:SET domain-containing protein